MTDIKWTQRKKFWTRHCFSFATFNYFLRLSDSEEYLTPSFTLDKKVFYGKAYEIDC